MNLWADDYDEDIPEEEVSFDNSIEDDRSSSYRSGSVVSSRIPRNSHQLSKTNLSVLSRSDCSTSYSRFSQSEKIPSAESESQILDLLAGSGYPMTQINGQRKLGPPPGWSKPAPDANCEVFVGKIPRNLYEDALYPIFDAVGEIYEIRLMMDFSGTNRGYCFVMFTKIEYAQRAINELNNWEIRKGRRIGVVASINNCRLCIGQLPPNIDSAIVIAKFHDMTDEVSKVSVYKNISGQVRYALVSYQTHRGAAMARRRLLPERAGMFDHVEVTIEWANPSMLPNNGVEDTGIRDETGAIRINTTTVGHYSKRGGSQRRGRDDFLEKSIKNYLQERSIGQNASRQCNNSVDSSGRTDKSAGRVCQFTGRRRTGRARSSQRRSFKDSLARSGKENCFGNCESLSSLESRREEGVEWYPENRDINGNITLSKNFRAIRSESLRTDKKISRHEELSRDVKNFPSKGSLSFNLFEHYTLAPEVLRDCVPGKSYEQRSAPNSPQNGQRNDHDKTANFPDHEGRNCAESFGPKRSPEFINTSLDLSRNDSLKVARSQRKNSRQSSLEGSITTQRSRNSTNYRAPGSQFTSYGGNFAPSQENTRGLGNFFKTRDNSCPTTVKNLCTRDYCQECLNQAQYFQQRLNFPPTISINQPISCVSDNYYRPPLNPRTNNSTPTLDLSQPRQQIVLPFGAIVPQSFYGTSSFADYRAAQIYHDKTQQTSPRPILSRMTAARLGDEI